MIAYSLDKKEIASSESTDYSLSGITKKKWQTPNILEMDYTATEYNSGMTIDGGMTGNEPTSS